MTLFTLYLWYTYTFSHYQLYFAVSMVFVTLLYFLLRFLFNMPYLPIYRLFLLLFLLLKDILYLKKLIT